MRTSGGFAALAAAVVVVGSTNVSAQPVARLTAHVSGTPADALAPLRAGVDETFAGDGRVTYKPLSELLPEEKTEDPAALLKKADDDLDEGDKAFSGMDIDPAKQRLNAAVEAYRTHLPELLKRDGNADKLKTAWLLLSKVYFFDGDTANARLALRHCMTLDQALVFTPEMFPPQMKKLVQEVRTEYDLAGVGRVVVESVPAGASIWVDGVAKSGAMTPVELSLPNGPHDIQLELGGHKRVVESVDVPGGSATKLAAALPELPSRAEAKLTPIVARLDSPTAPPEAAQAARELGVDIVVFVAASPGAAGHVSLRGWVYDVRRNVILKRGTRDLAGSEQEIKLGGAFFARELTNDVRLDGQKEPPPHKATFVERWQTFRESKWFWPVVGAVAGLVATGAAVGIGVGVANQRAATDDAVNSVVLIGGR